MHDHEVSKTRCPLATCQERLHPPHTAPYQVPSGTQTRRVFVRYKTRDPGRRLVRHSWRTGTSLRGNIVEI